MSWKLNNILLSVYGIIPGQVDNEGLAVKGIFDLPKRIGITFKDWDDQNSVEPYVDADEIFLEGRDIIFQGILEGTKSETEYNIEWLKLDIDDFNSLVPFETPYGTYFVYVKQIIPKIYNGIATVLIEFREPDVSIVSAPIVSDTIYYSAVYSETAIKNNCAVGYHGLEVSLASTLGQFTSTISQIAANQLAIDWVRENKQNHANVASSGTYCEINPPIYYNAELTNSLQRDNCGVGYTGSIVNYTILADVYSSDGRTDPTASQAKADAKAQAAMDLILTQTYANERGYCSTLPYIKETYNSFAVTVFLWGGQTIQHFEIGGIITAGTIYNIMIYGVIKSYTSTAYDSAYSIVTALMNLINNTTAIQWNAANAAPILDDALNYKPKGYILNNNTLKITIPPTGSAVSWIT